MCMHQSLQKNTRAKQRGKVRQWPQIKSSQLRKWWEAEDLPDLHTGTHLFLGT